ncbi:MAG: hypothetical protein N4A49_09210 [Marinifilaceae bacterium]|nr:hypothetical protein [Marinifilaceae bacterium]
MKYFILIMMTILVLGCSNDDEDLVSSGSELLGGWGGVIYGDEEGTWSAVISDNGEINGNLKFANSSRTYSIQGNVSKTGIVDASIDGDSSESNFIGSFSEGECSGIWDIEGDKGTWSGRQTYVSSGQSNSDASTYNEFKITNGTYSYNSDWDQIIDNNFGSDYRVADWSDLESFYKDGGNLIGLYNYLGRTQYNNSIYVKRNGRQFYSSSRAYFASRHEGDVPDSFAVHDDIGNNILSLGSWHGSNYILAIRRDDIATGLDEDFNDGNYSNNPNWTVENIDDIPGSIVVDDNYVKFRRTGAGGNGGGIYLSKTIDIALRENTKLRFDVNPVYSDVGNGAGWSNGEYPANVYLYLLDSSNNELVLRFCYNYRGGQSKYEDDDIRVVFPYCSKNKWLRKEEFIIKDYFPQAIKITKIKIGGNGWNFESLIDNISIQV